MTKPTTKCTCGLGNKTYCPRCSRLRMVILLKNGNDNLKTTTPDGKEYNPVWYSFLKYNNYDLYKIAEKMEANVKKHPVLSQAANVLQFYINGNRSHAIKKVTL